MDFRNEYEQRINGENNGNTQFTRKEETHTSLKTYTRQPGTQEGNIMEMMKLMLLCFSKAKLNKKHSRILKKKLSTKLSQ